MPNPTITITRGPAIVSYNNVVYYTKTPVKAMIDWGLFDVGSDQFGPTSKRVKSRLAKVTFTPAGKFVAGLWPYAATRLGANVMPATQKDILVQPLDTTQKMWTFYGGVITKAPKIVASASKTLFGEVELTALGKYATTPGTAASLVLRATNTFNDTSFVPSDILIQPYTVTLGATGIETKEGTELELDWKLSPIESDTYGIVGYTLDGCGAKARFTPRSMTEDDFVALFNSGNLESAIGAGLDGGQDLVVAGTGITATLYNAVLEKLDPTWGLTEDRIGALELMARRKITTGASTAMYALA